MQAVIDYEKLGITDLQLPTGEVLEFLGKKSSNLGDTKLLVKFHIYLLNAVYSFLWRIFFKNL